MFKVVPLMAVSMAGSLIQEEICNVAICDLEKGEQLYILLEQHSMLNTEFKPQTTGTELAIALTPSQRTTEHHIKQLLAPVPFEVRFERRFMQRTPASVDPHRRLTKAIQAWLVDTKIEPSISEICRENRPKKWEKYDDLIILPETAFANESWAGVLRNVSLEDKTLLWKDVAESLYGTRLARQHPIANTVQRDSQTELLHGKDGWVEFTDHGVQFGLDVTRVMFSSGNVTERRRIGSISMEGETVVDAYAGVGYYTLHMAMRSGAKHVHACEINPHSITGLEWAIRENQLEHCITVHPGDNQQTLPTLYGKADRCHLGLLPSSKPVWEHAIRCLKPEGGWLHVHMNVAEQAIDEWVEQTRSTLEEMAQRNARQWSIEVEHVEKVKWYSPHVRHVVVDVLCSKSSIIDENRVK